MYWTAFLLFASHEGYPGHHTEFILKEQHLYREQNQFEHSILILHSPKLIISEGIANNAISVLFSDEEAVKIGLREFCIDPSKESSLEQLVMQERVKKTLPLFWYNFAYHAKVDMYSDRDLLNYGKDRAFFDKEALNAEIKRLSDKVYSKNAFLYHLGNITLKQKYKKVPSVNEYRDLLIKAVLPSDLR
jgi:hypothetical protein